MSCSVLGNKPCYDHFMGSGKGRANRALAVTVPWSRAIPPCAVVTHSQVFADFVDSQGIKDVLLVDYYSMRQSFEAADKELVAGDDGEYEHDMVGDEGLMRDWVAKLAGELFRDLVGIGAVELGPKLDVGKFVFTVGLDGDHVDPDCLVVSYDGGAPAEVLVVGGVYESFNDRMRMGKLKNVAKEICYAVCVATGKY